MKKVELKESQVLLEVRRIKEQLAGEAENDPGYYQRLNGLGARLLPTGSSRPAESASGTYLLHDKPAKKDAGH